MGLPEDDASELAQEEREEPIRIWIEENRVDLENEYIMKFHSDNQPLDDDYSDFFECWCDEFDNYCKEQYRDFKED